MDSPLFSRHKPVTDGWHFVTLVPGNPKFVGTSHSVDFCRLLGLDGIHDSRSALQSFVAMNRKSQAIPTVHVQKRRAPVFVSTCGRELRLCLFLWGITIMTFGRFFMTMLFPRTSTWLCLNTRCHPRHGSWHSGSSVKGFLFRISFFWNRSTIAH